MLVIFDMGWLVEQQKELKTAVDNYAFDEGKETAEYYRMQGGVIALEELKKKIMES